MVNITFTEASFTATLEQRIAPRREVQVSTHVCCTYQHVRDYSRKLPVEADSTLAALTSTVEVQHQVRARFAIELTSPTMPAPIGTVAVDLRNSARRPIVPEVTFAPALTSTFVSIYKPLSGGDYVGRGYTHSRGASPSISPP